MANTKETDAADQMNLSALKYLTKSFLVGFFRFLSFCAFVVRRRKYMLIGAAFLGVFVAMFYYYVAQTKYYQASIVLSSSLVPKRVYGGIIGQLDELARTRSSDKLAAELDVPLPVAKNILSIESRNMMDEDLQMDTSNRLGEPFQVFIAISHNDVGSDVIEDAFVNYLNNLPYLRKILSVQQSSDSMRLEQLERDLAAMDTLKVNYNKFLAASKISATVYSDAIDPAKIYSETGGILDDIRDTRRRLLVDNVDVAPLNHIKIANTTRSKSLPILLLILGPGALLFGFLIALLMEVRNRLLN